MSNLPSFKKIPKSKNNITRRKATYDLDSDSSLSHSDSSSDSMSDSDSISSSSDSDTALKKRKPLRPKTS